MSQLIPGYRLIKDAIAGSAKYRKRVVVVGTRGSSKTTSLGCLSLTCDTKSLREPNFSAYIEEMTSGILRVPSDLCQGKFPVATPPGWLYEANLVMRWKTRFGTKEVVLPFCETAGEDMEKLIGPYTQSIYQRAPNYQEAKALTDYICNSNGYIITVPVSRALMFEGEQRSIEKEPDSLLPDPDVNIRRILAAILRYKRESKSPETEGIAVLLTQYDMIEAFCKSRGMNLYDHEGAERFLHTYFRMTASLLKHHGMEKVKFFPVYVQVKTARNPDNSVRFTNEIETDPSRNLPRYAESSYLQLIEWIRETFTK